MWHAVKEAIFRSSRPQLAGPLLVSLMLASISVRAQNPSIEEIEARLRAAEAAELRRQEAAREEARRAQAEAEREQARRKAAADAKAAEERRQAEKRARIAEERRQAEAAAVGHDAIARFVSNGNNTITDANTGLVWAERDNGIDINWSDAVKFCADIGTGWQLPKMSVLTALYEAGDQPSKCGPYTCKITELIHLSSTVVWSSDTDGSDKAWTLSFLTGSAVLAPITNSRHGRALCVRGS